MRSHPTDFLIISGRDTTMLVGVKLTSNAVLIWFVSPTIRQGINSLSHSESPLKED